jgi:hypothetical protein
MVDCLDQRNGDRKPVLWTADADLISVCRLPGSHRFNPICWSAVDRDGTLPTHDARYHAEGTAGVTVEGGPAISVSRTTFFTRSGNLVAGHAVPVFSRDGSRAKQT